MGKKSRADPLGSARMLGRYAARFEAAAQKFSWVILTNKTLYGEILS
jgi:hypothetical protein